MTRHAWRVALAVVVLIPMFRVAVVGAESADSIVVGAFASATEGGTPAPGWKPLTFKKIPKITDYTTVRDGETVVVRAESRAGASGLTREVSIDLKEYPVVAWRWKVSNVIAGGDLTKKQGDDYAARLYITFAYEADKVRWSRKAKYQAGRLLFGEIPIAAINYIWDRAAPVGTVAPNAYTDFVRMIVVESGAGNIGRWMDEERNLYDDYRRAFGGEPPKVNGVAIMTDTDNTGETATAYYGDIVFKRAK
ncbi:MAG: DUF3047 domain-containing protein [Nitrospirota bacterium]